MLLVLSGALLAKCPTYFLSFFEGCVAPGCKVRKNKWARHIKTEKHRKGVERGGIDGKVGGDIERAEVGRP